MSFGDQKAEKLKASRDMSMYTDEIHPGDEVFVLAKPDVKSLQLTKDIMQVIYQVAVSAAVVLAI